jgi:hypothetical protein
MRQQTPHRKPHTIRVIPITDRGGHTRYYMDGLRPPVPAWMRHLDGWSVRVVVILVGLGLAFISAGAVLFWK